MVRKWAANENANLPLGPENSRNPAKEGEEPGASAKIRPKASECLLRLTLDMAIRHARRFRPLCYFGWLTVRCDPVHRSYLQSPDIDSASIP